MRSGTLAHSEQVPKLQVSIESDSTMALSSLSHISSSVIVVVVGKKYSLGPFSVHYQTERFLLLFTKQIVFYINLFIKIND
jgi:hypothetical protein